MGTKARFFSLIIFIFFLQSVFVSVAAAATRIMPLGDSITYDDYVGDTRPPSLRTSYRSHLWYSLMDAGYEVDFVGSEVAGQNILPPIDPDNEGHPGFSTDQIRAEVFDWLQLNPADIILLHIGTNDISDPQTVAEIVLEVKEILDEIFAYSTEITVILAKIINHKSFSQKTNDFNNLLPGMVNTHPNKGNVIIVDMEVGAGIDYGTDMIDDLHPNENGYSKMADVWFDALEQILPDPRPEADFTADPISGVPPLSVNFTDQSTRIITSWSWDFGDGSTSDEQNPIHTYNDPGTYTVSLAVTGLGLSDTKTETDYITVGPIPLNSGVSVSDSVSQGEWVYYQIDASASDIQIQVELTNLSNDVDLYVREGDLPILSVYDCRPYSAGTTPESCNLPNSGENTWYIGVYGYHSGDFTITATLTGALNPGDSCGKDKVLDCSLACVDQWKTVDWVGDIYCDDENSPYGVNLVCPEFNNDGGDCGGSGKPGTSCGTGKVYDCVGNCVDEATAQSWTGDGYCDDGTWGMDLRCDAFNNDGSDCGPIPGTSCGEGVVYDCVGNCVDEAKAQSWTGDGYCDDGTWGMDLSCSAFDNDGGDCGS